MTLNLTPDAITSDVSSHAARHTGPEPGQWELTWLPGQALTRNQAITGMILAEAALGLTVADTDQRHLLNALAGELDLDLPAAQTALTQTMPTKTTPGPRPRTEAIGHTTTPPPITIPGPRAGGIGL